MQYNIESHVPMSFAHAQYASACCTLILPTHKNAETVPERECMPANDASLAARS